MVTSTPSGFVKQESLSERGTGVAVFHGLEVYGLAGSLRVPNAGQSKQSLSAAAIIAESFAKCSVSFYYVDWLVWCNVKRQNPSPT